MKYTEIDKSKLVVVYCRVSSKQQVDEGNSLSTQEKNCLKFINNSKLTLAENGIFIEKGESAKDVDRTALKKIIPFIQEHKNVGYVIINKIDRFSRNTADYLAFKATLLKYGVKIVSTTEPIEDSPTGRFIETMLVSAAQLDNEIRAERCTDGVKEALKDGRYVFPPALGYTKIGTHGSINIAPDEKVVPYIKKIFELIASGYHSSEDVRQIITKDGLRTRQGKKIIKSHFYALVRNPVYKGWIICKKYDINIQGNFKSIIDSDLFEAVQAILENRNAKKPIYKKLNTDFPLRGTLKHTCGYSLTGAWAKGKTKRYAKYRCTHCTSFNPNTKEINEKYLKYLSKASLKPAASDVLRYSLQYNWQKDQQTKVNYLQSLSRQLEDLQKKRQGIAEKNLNGVIGDDLAKEMLTQTESDIYNCKQELKQYKSSEDDLDELLTYSLQALSDMPKFWSDMDITQKNAFQKFVFPKGITYDGKKLRTPEKIWTIELNEALADQKFTKMEVRGIEPLFSYSKKEVSPKTV